MRKSILSATIAALEILFAGTALADRIVIDHVTLIDGRDTPTAADMTVVIDGNKFVSVAPSALAQETGGKHIDGRGKYLIPGLMDMHVHLRGSTEITKDGLRKVALKRAEGVAALQSYIYSGVTSIFDAGNVPDYIFELRDAERAGKLYSPHIFATGGIVTHPGSHGSGPGSTDIESWPEAKAALDAHIVRKPDVLKLTLEERGWGARPMIPYLDQTLLERVVEYYNDHGIRTTIHTSNEFRARQAIFAGIDSLAHPIIQGPASDAFVKLMGAKKIPMVTTLTIGENYSRLAEHPEYLDQPLYKASLSADEITMLKTKRRTEWNASTWTWWMKLMTPIAQENLRKFYESGSVLVVGTDQTVGPAVHREMELLAAAGISPAAILQMATLHGAIFLGREKDMGSVEAGKLADAVLLNSDPTVDINNAKDIALVIKNGKILDESKLNLAGGPVKKRWQ